jgi:hypothetical protein
MDQVWFFAALFTFRILIFIVASLAVFVMRRLSTLTFGLLTPFCLIPAGSLVSVPAKEHAANSFPAEETA